MVRLLKLQNAPVDPGDVPGHVSFTGFVDLEVLFGHLIGVQVPYNPFLYSLVVIMQLQMTVQMVCFLRELLLLLRVSGARKLLWLGQG